MDDLDLAGVIERRSCPWRMEQGVSFSPILSNLNFNSKSYDRELYHAFHDCATGISDMHHIANQVMNGNVTITLHRIANQVSYHA